MSICGDMSGSFLQEARDASRAHTATLTAVNVSVSELEDAPSCEEKSDSGDEVVWTDVSKCLFFKCCGTEFHTYTNTNTEC